ncbi:MAG: hypothetical protein M0Q91_16165 [Methanoregula sp.]|jgi:hypothetical protein|nr:hypothetical protein [Methanoregula sp.]
MYLISASATPVGHSYGGFSVYITDTNGKGPDGIGGGLTFNEFVEPSYKGTKSAHLMAGKFVVSVESGCAYTITINPL